MGGATLGSAGEKTVPGATADGRMPDGQPPEFPRSGVLPRGSTGIEASPVAMGGRNGNKRRAFSLVMSTIGRGPEIGLFLESLKRQTFQDFEVIVVDQLLGPLQHARRIDAVVVREGDDIATGILQADIAAFRGSCR